MVASLYSFFTSSSTLGELWGTLYPPSWLKGQALKIHLVSNEAIFTSLLPPQPLSVVYWKVWILPQGYHRGLNPILYSYTWEMTDSTCPPVGGVLDRMISALHKETNRQSG